MCALKPISERERDGKVQPSAMVIFPTAWHASATTGCSTPKVKHLTVICYNSNSHFALVYYAQHADG